MYHFLLSYVSMSLFHAIPEVLKIQKNGSGGFLSLSIETRPGIVPNTFFLVGEIDGSPGIAICLR